MKEIFAKRRFQFIHRCLGYLRYVFNDHFVLVCLVLVGFAMVEYGRLLNNFPANHLPIIFFLVCLLFVLLSLGRVATYIEEPDRQFLLIREEEMIDLMKAGLWRAIFVWGLLQTLVLALLSPIFLALGLSLSGQICLGLFLWGLKGLIIRLKIGNFYRKGQLDWDRAIIYEQRRKQSVLKFFSLFTDVKGISSKVKRRAYLDRLLSLLPRESKKLWLNLYGRAFLRSGDYLGLSLRLFFLSILGLVFIDNRLLAEGVAVLFNYLWIFQLTVLANHYDYYYLKDLYPVQQGKRENLLIFLRLCLLVVNGLQVFVSLMVGFQGALVMGNLLLLLLYLPYRVKS